MPEIQTKNKLITLEELGVAYNNITPANIGAVAKSGDTMTGNLIIEKNNSNISITEQINNRASLSLYNDVSGMHGVYSNGYWNGSAFVSNPTWLIYRETDGKVTVVNHYNKDEVDAKIGSFSCPNGVELAINLPSSSITSAEAETAIDSMFTSIPYGFSVRVGSFNTVDIFIMLIGKIYKGYGFVKCIGYTGTEYTWVKSAGVWTCKKIDLANA